MKQVELRLLSNQKDVYDTIDLEFLPSTGGYVTVLDKCYKVVTSYVHSPEYATDIAATLIVVELCGPEWMVIK